jgi:hypothetical protein
MGVVALHLYSPPILLPLLIPSKSKKVKEGEEDEEEGELYALHDDDDEEEGLLYQYRPIIQQH